ncbi:MAG: hypothetical protein ACYTX0_21100 [Nostoc sp.]
MVGIRGSPDFDRTGTRNMETILSSLVNSPLAQPITDVSAQPDDLTKGLKLFPNWGSIRKF